MDLYSFLEGSPLCAGASKEHLEALMERVKLCEYKRGQMMLLPTEVSQTFLYVILGWAKLSTESASGEDVIMRMMTQHDYCGDSFIFPGQTYSPAYAVQAITSVQAFTVPLVYIRECMFACHPLALNLLRGALSRRQELGMEIEHLSIQSAAQRIGCFILRLADQYKLQNNRLRLPYDKFLLATQLGMRAETFSRALDRLARACGMKIVGDSILIEDVMRVSHYVCTHCSLQFPCMPKNHKPLHGVTVDKKEAQEEKSHAE